MAECQRCSFQKVVESVAELMKTFRHIGNDKSKDKACELNHAQFLVRKTKNNKVRNAAKALEGKFSELLKEIDKNILPLCQKVCLACATSANDDNPSNHGRTFVSIDALNSAPAISDDINKIGDKELMDSEQNPYDKMDSDKREVDDEPIDDDRSPGATGSWLHRNAVRTVHALDPNGSTNLPSHIEDILRKVLHDFSALDIYEQNLIFQQMSGMSFSDFGSMAWIPSEMKKPQSKQLVSIRWEKLVSKFPLAAALRNSKPLKDLNTERNRHYNDEYFVQDELML